jgi:hypothetical protein
MKRAAFRDAVMSVLSAVGNANFLFLKSINRFWGGMLYVSQKCYASIVTYKLS